MNVELTKQQQAAMDQTGEGPTRFIDPRTHAAYVLVPEADYETLRELLEDERQQRAIRAVGRKNAVGRLDEQP